MKNHNHIMLGAIILLLLALPVVSLAQRTRPTLNTNSATSYRYAYEHGYRAGYEDGFAHGKSDVGREQLRDFWQIDNYDRADRTYQGRMGLQVEYQEGYRYGFELGYQDGYFGRAYTTAIPSNLGRLVNSKLNVANRPRAIEERRPIEPERTSQDRAPQRGEMSVPADIQMKIRLNDKVSTKESREGDRFSAIVLDPSSYADAEIIGHIAKLKKSGSATGKTELMLAFDTITLRNGRTLRMNAQVERVYESDTVKQTDEEGNIETGGRGRDTAVRTGGGAALGAIIGAIAGGGKGAAIGAAIGAGVGAGSVFIEGGKNLTLEPGTEMLIRTVGRSY